MLKQTKLIHNKPFAQQNANNKILWVPQWYIQLCSQNKESIKIWSPISARSGRTQHNILEDQIRQEIECFIERDIEGKLVVVGIWEWE